MIERITKWLIWRTFDEPNIRMAFLNDAARWRDSRPWLDWRHQLVITILMPFVRNIHKWRDMTAREIMEQYMSRVSSAPLLEVKGGIDGVELVRIRR